MSFESLDFAYHRGIDNKFTYRLHWAQILLILCKRPNKIYFVKMLKNQTQTVWCVHWQFRGLFKATLQPSLECLPFRMVPIERFPFLSTRFPSVASLPQSKCKAYDHLGGFLLALKCLFISNVLPDAIATRRDLELVLCLMKLSILWPNYHILRF